MCGEITRTVTEDDSEYDYRFTKNHLVANETEQMVGTDANFDSGEVCVYVITKNHSYEHLNVQIEGLVQTDVYVHRGENTYTGEMIDRTALDYSTELDYEYFGDSEYLYLIAVAQTTASEVSVRVSSRILKEVIKEVDEDSLGGSTSSSNINLALVIGLVVGLLGFIAIIVAIIFLVRKQNKRKQHQEFNDVRRIKKKP